MSVVSVRGFCSVDCCISSTQGSTVSYCKDSAARVECRRSFYQQVGVNVLERSQVVMVPLVWILDYLNLLC